jgi:hypothetical protein
MIDPDATTRLQAKPISRQCLLYRNAFGPGLWVQMTYSSRLIYSHDQLHAINSFFHPLLNNSSACLPKHALHTAP